MVFDDVTLKSVNCPPINSQAVFMTATEVHLNFWSGRVFSSSALSVRSPDPSIQCVNSFAFVMTVVECLGLRVWMGC